MSGSLIAPPCHIATGALVASQAATGWTQPHLFPFVFPYGLFRGLIITSDEGEDYCPCGDVHRADVLETRGSKPTRFIQTIAVAAEPMCGY